MVMNKTSAIPATGLSIIERVGNTPLLRFERICADVPHAEIYAKAEWTNPGGSVKDRAAAGIVQEAFRSGKMSGGKRLLDSTSGNTGIAYAMLGAACGFGVTLCMPANVSVERKRILKAYGAEIIYTAAGEGSDGAIVKAREIIAEHPDKYFYADQYSNDANWQAHYCGTAKEIWEQTRGRITHFVTMLGTSGTFMGTTRRLKELNPRIRMHLAATRLALPWHRRSEVYANFDRAADLRSHAGGPQPGNQHRRLLRHGQAAGPRRRTAGWAVLRSVTGGRVAGRTRSQQSTIPSWYAYSVMVLTSISANVSGMRVRIPTTKSSGS